MHTTDAPSAPPVENVLERPPKSSFIPVSNNFSNEVSPTASELLPPWIIENMLRKVPSRCGFTSHLVNSYSIKNRATTLVVPLSIIYSDSLLNSNVPAPCKALL